MFDLNEEKQAMQEKRPKWFFEITCRFNFFSWIKELFHKMGARK